MAVTGAIFKALTFNGESSRDYGVYITGEGVYDAPKRDVEMITIPGRNGSFPLDHGRYENIEVTYPAGVFADNEADFAEAISDFRNMLCSANGYCRLEDEYNPYEYRMAVYKSGLEVDPTLLKAGEFDITFECKPQRYLKSGEVPVTMGEWADVETLTGNPIIYDAGDPAKEVKNLDVELTPIQEGSGTPSPQNVRPITGHDSVTVTDTGKNLLKSYAEGTTQTQAGMTGTANADGTITFNGTTTGTFWGLGDSPTFTLKAGTYTLSQSEIITNLSTMLVRVVEGGTNIVIATVGTTLSNTFTTTEDYTVYFYNRINTGVTLTNKTMYFQLEHGSTATDYAPYHGQSKTVTLPHTVYGGKPNITTGDGTETLANIASYNGETINEPWWSSMDEYVQGTTPTTGAQVVYTLATPTDLSTTPTDITLYNGDNVISSDGQMTLEVGELISGVDNPTRFEASPLILTKGYGTLSFNNKTITINNAGTMGQMVLWESATINALTGSIDLEFDSWAFKATDSFTFNVFDNIVTELAPSSQTASNPNAVLTSDTVTVIEAGGTQTTAKHLQVKLPVTITVGTASTTTNTTKYTQGSKWIQVEMTVTYDGNGHITYTVVETDTGDVTIYNQYCDINVPATTAISTLSRLGDPTYIDFDIGEVYMMNSGKPVSLNKFVDLGSDLAVLEPGSNTFTYDNTFTEVKVVPRWWKL